MITSLQPSPIKLLPRFLSFENLFGNQRPVDVELGCGKGKLLLALAEQNPDKNFIGVEKAGKWLRKVELRRNRRSISNLLFVRADAREFVREHLAPQSVHGFYIYFPDPWPKNRHRPRRLLTRTFLALLHIRLIPGGFLDLATDDRSYFDSVCSALGDVFRWQKVERRTSKVIGEKAASSYEEKFFKLGRLIYYLRATK